MEVCAQYGYRRVIPPAVSGPTQVYDMQRMLRAIINDYDYYSLDSCKDTLMELACGLHATRCSAGEALPSICREDCEGTV